MAIFRACGPDSGQVWRPGRNSGNSAGAPARARAGKSTFSGFSRFWPFFGFSVNFLKIAVFGHFLGLMDYLSSDRFLAIF